METDNDSATMDDDTHAMSELGTKLEDPTEFGVTVQPKKKTIQEALIPSSTAYYNKLFNESMIKFTNCEVCEEAKVLVLQNQNLSEFSDANEILLPNACILKLSNNKLTTSAINQMWTKFPSTWWLDLSHNDIVFLDCFFPLALGSLNLVGNNLPIQELKLLKRIHILKLKVVLLDDITNNVAVSLCNVLPNAWVINDDFVTYGVRNPKEALNATFEQTVDQIQQQFTRGPAMSDTDFSVVTSGDNKEMDYFPPLNHLSTSFAVVNHFRSNYSASGGGDWRVIQPNDRELNIMRAVQDIPIYDQYADAFKLDILIEDYLEEASIFNSFARNLSLTNNSAIKSMKLMPMVDIYNLLLVPHRVRLDLSVLLTTSIIFPLPPALFKETLTILLVKYIPLADIESLPELPLYVRTGLVSIIRRIARRELEEVQANANRLVEKPSREAISLSEYDLIHNRPTPTYIGQNGFNFIRAVKMYQAWPILDRVDASPYTTFSELELDILKKLPDIPTASIGNQCLNPTTESSSSGQPSYNDWISFACRHTVLLLNKSPSCPSLMRPQRNATAQDTYFQLLPILKASNMTYDDLAISMTGVNQDGRILSMRTATSVRTVKRTPITVNAAATGLYVNLPPSLLDTESAKMSHTLEDSTKTLGGRFLPFGVGLPNATPHSLMWNDEVVPIARNYEKLWNSHLVSDDDQNNNNNNAEGENAAFFMTEGDSNSPPVNRGPSHRNTVRVPSPTILKRDRLYSTSEIDTSKVLTLNAEPEQPLRYEHTTSTDLLTRYDLKAPEVPSPKRSQSRSKHNSPERDPAATGDLTKSFEEFVQEVQELSQENLNLLNQQSAIEFNDSSIISQPPGSIMVSIQLPSTPGQLRGSVAVDSPMIGSPVSGDDNQPHAQHHKHHHHLHSKLQHQSSTNSFNLDHDDDEMNDSVMSGLLSGMMTPDDSKLVHPHASVYSIDNSSIGLITVPSITLDADLNASIKDPLDQYMDSKLLPSRIQEAKVPAGQGKFQTLIPAKISGYSADAKWNSSFILAPPQAIQQYNTLKVITNDELNCWENLEFAPVIVSSPTQRIPLSTVQQSLNQQQQQQQQNQQNYATVADNGGVSAPNSMSLSSVVNPEQMALPQSPLTIATGQNSMTLSHIPSGPPSPVKLFSPKQATTPTRGSKRRQQQQMPQPVRSLAEEIKLEEAKLLREMGTVKNTFDINQSQKIKHSSFQSINVKTNRSFDEDSIESNAIHFPEIPHMSNLLVETVRNQRKLAEKKASNKKKAVVDDTVFLTGVKEVNELEDEDEFEHDDFEEDTKAIEPLSELDKTFQQIEALKNTVSSLDVLKVKHKYGNIYTNHASTEFGYITEGGKHLDATWYPCIPKPMYRLKASASVDGLALPPQPLKAARRHSLTKGNRKSLLTPISGTLFQNSILTKVPYYKTNSDGIPVDLGLTHRKTPYNDLVESTNHNLRVLSRSCTFLKATKLAPLEYNDDSITDDGMAMDPLPLSKPASPGGSATLLSIAAEVSAEYIASHTMSDLQQPRQQQSPKQQVSGELRPPSLQIAQNASFSSSFNNNGRVTSPASLVMNAVRNDLFVPPVTPNFLKGQASRQKLPGESATGPTQHIRVPVSNSTRRPLSGGVARQHSPKSPKGSPKASHHINPGAAGLSPSSLMNKSFSSNSLVLSVNSHKKKMTPGLSGAAVSTTGGTAAAHHSPPALHGYHHLHHGAANGMKQPDEPAMLTITLPFTETASNTIDNETVNSQLEAGAIYEAYSSRISAARNEEWETGVVMDDNSSVWSSTSHQGRHRRDSGRGLPRVLEGNPPTGLITQSFINNETAGMMQLPFFGALHKPHQTMQQTQQQQLQQYLPEHQRRVESREHRAQQMTGHSESPWVGRNHYKAATHRVELNRSFRYTKPKTNNKAFAGVEND